jgi:hypothetical protein
MLTVEHLKRALVHPSQCGVPDPPSPGSLHQARSSEWVRCLAGELKQLYADSPDVRVFHKGDGGNREDFGLNELLYDVCVCQTAPCASARQGKTLRHITRALWQVESEFARDSFEAVKDFNKLVLGAAENKLFIGRARRRRPWSPPIWTRCCRSPGPARAPCTSAWCRTRAIGTKWKSTLPLGG